MSGPREDTRARVRRPAVAGRFYPEDPAALRATVEACLAAARAPAGLAPKAIVAPHAGYAYSGPIAASAYACLGRDRDTIRRVVLLGPSHHVDFEGLAVPGAEAFATPLGLVPVDADAIQGLRDLPQIATLDLAHEAEHSLEVHLPFLQIVLAEFRIVPLVVGDAGDGEIADVLDRLWSGAETRVVVSSDLSHDHDDATARVLDRATCRRIESLQAVTPDQACGARPVSGLLEAARRHGLDVHTLDLRTSADTAGGRRRVVGYGAWAFCDPA